LKTIKIEITEKAWVKLSSYAALKELLGSESQTTSDLFLKKVVKAVNDGSDSVEMRAKED
tara:strand:+ start:83472 stop:83651 length:180 start_codon:yes stop_codon:yes gene_type:complete